MFNPWISELPASGFRKILGEDPDIPTDPNIFFGSTIYGHLLGEHDDQPVDGMFLFPNISSTPISIEQIHRMAPSMSRTSRCVICFL